MNFLSRNNGQFLFFFLKIFHLHVGVVDSNFEVKLIIFNVMNQYVQSHCTFFHFLLKLSLQPLILGLFLFSHLLQCPSEMLGQSSSRTQRMAAAIQLDLLCFQNTFDYLLSRLYVVFTSLMWTFLSAASSLRRLANARPLAVNHRMEPFLLIFTIIEFI